MAFLNKSRAIRYFFYLLIKNLTFNKIFNKKKKTKKH